MLIRTHLVSACVSRAARITGICLVACLALGCRQFSPPRVTGEPDGGLGPERDGSPGVDGPDPSAFPYPPSNFDPALLPAPVDSIVLDCGVSELDSENLGFFNWCGRPAPVIQVLDQDVGLPQLAVLTMSGLTVEAGSTLRIRGNKSVILAALGPVTVNGAIDASADGEVDGSGVMVCPGGLDGTTANDTGGGGGGGGFGTPGAVGAIGEDGGDGGAGGSSSGDPALVPLHGGCRGGAGAPVTGGGSGGNGGGGGGGAIQISATTTLEVTAGGIIASSGGGGRPGGLHDGGGGGGSGGAVLLEGASVVIASDAALTANGGGGGEAGSSSNPQLEDPGEPGSFDSLTPAAGGSVGASSGDGGNGGVQGIAPTQGLTSPDQVGNGGGGGGGGGSVGRVRINASTSCSISGGSLQSPSPTGNGAAGCP